jgi:two-component system response regulator AtoC
MEATGLLIASSDRQLYSSLAGGLSDGYDVDSVETGTAALEKIKTGRFRAALVDIDIKAVGSFDLVKKISSLGYSLCVIIVCSGRDIDSALSLVKIGAFDFVVKPVDYERIRLVLRNGLEKIALLHEINILKDSSDPTVQISNQILNICPTSQKILQAIERVIHTESTILLTGESGTGKGILARAIHSYSNRKKYPFRAVDCSAMPEDLIESELFGHEKGAFTGAISRKTGKFEAAEKGTLFLDEISNINLDVQAKLLRVIQEKEFERIGGNQLIKLNARIIAASNKDMKMLVKQGLFREDLYYRLNVVPVYLPPLRERREEIPLLIDYFLNLFNNEYSRDIVIDIEGRLFLTQYDWPGNIRQLENMVRRIVLMSAGGGVGREAVTAIMLSEDSSDPEKKESMAVRRVSGDYYDENGKIKTLADIEKDAILSALSDYAYNISETAKALGVTRKTIHNKLKLYNIVIKRKAE